MSYLLERPEHIFHHFDTGGLQGDEAVIKIPASGTSLIHEKSNIVTSSKLLVDGVRTLYQRTEYWYSHEEGGKQINLC